jgi:hypothetical protein
MTAFKPPDYSNLSFDQLAKDDHEFGEVYKANKNWVDFHNPKIVKYGDPTLQHLEADYPY